MILQLYTLKDPREKFFLEMTTLKPPLIPTSEALLLRSQLLLKILSLTTASAFLAISRFAFSFQKHTKTI